MRLLLVIFLITLLKTSYAEGDGYGENIGGAGGDTIIVDNKEDFKSIAGKDGSYVILVKGVIDVGSEVRVTSYKTISGIDSTSTVLGGISIKSGTHDVVIKNLNITNPLQDGITIRQAKYIYITNCTIYDCADGCIDVTVESDFVTISYCRFYYENVTFHKFVNLIGADDADVTDRGKLHVTMHHNWWDKNCDCRMPRVRYGRVHLYNNYYSCAGNQYSTSARIESEIFSEHNFYESVNSPFDVEDGGKAKSIGNKYINCTGNIFAGDNDVFTPSYTYTTSNADKAKEDVLKNAGNRKKTRPQNNSKKETEINWSDIGSIIFGTKLDNSHLNATASGNTSAPFYNLSTDSVLPEGYNTITVTFPEDENYNTASKTVNIHIVYEYFLLDLNISNGVDPSLVAVNSEEIPQNGLYKYPKGTIITMTASSNQLFTFDHWNDGDTNPIKSIKLESDIEITAVYNLENYIVGWDFYSEGNKSRIADFYSDDLNQNSNIELLNQNGVSNTWRFYSGTSTTKWFGKYAAIIGKGKSSVGDYYFQIRFNAKNYKNIRVSASMLGLLTHYEIQDVEYSTDGTNFIKIGEFLLEQDSIWYSNSFSLPQDADGCEAIMVRFIANKNSKLTTNNIIGTSISDVYVFADNYQGTNSISTKNNPNKQILTQQYFTINGIQTKKLLPGLNLILTTYSDGSKTIEKVIVNCN